MVRSLTRSSTSYAAVTCSRVVSSPSTSMVIREPAGFCPATTRLSKSRRLKDRLPGRTPGYFPQYRRLCFATPIRLSRKPGHKPGALVRLGSVSGYPHYVFSLLSTANPAVGCAGQQIVELSPKKLVSKRSLRCERQQRIGSAPVYSSICSGHRREPWAVRFLPVHDKIKHNRLAELIACSIAGASSAGRFTPDPRRRKLR